MAEEDLKRFRFFAILRLKDGLSPREIYDHVKKHDGEEFAKQIYLQAFNEVGDPDAKMSREDRRYWRREIEKMQ